ncbi:MAG: hypothetical protein GC203_09560 [Phenylobacterium sp.]|uniref:hypothetical protein n=1 Tax=Phenylobacterium sp. TaxID=1871053 RepID=UPI0025DF1E32|nr:hypothetical protein [Phenylobacterium sp.]MBI1198099.1 hypothetical protein [Phenylobacterium sp.]
MLRRVLMIAAAASAVASASQASEAKGKEEGEGKGDVGQYVDLLPVGLPIVYKDRLVNYVFVYVRINLTSAANVSKWREKEPFFRDALVRVAHRTPFSLPSDLSKIDTQRLSASLTAEAARIVGPGQIRSVVVTQQAPLHRYIQPAA